MFKIHILFVLILMSTLSFAQNAKVPNVKFKMKPQKCLIEVERDFIKNQIEINRELLQINQSQNLSQLSDLHVPVAVSNPPEGYFNFYAISNYVDHDATSGIVDYNCLENSYDNHKGIDYFSFPFEWHLYENDIFQAVSAAAGTVVFKQDGNFDQNCVWDTNNYDNWNAVYVQHFDGSTSWYGHLKNGSLTSKAIGDTVIQGEYLGVVASSGYSDGSHLHFEYYNANGELVDPYFDACNALNASSLWQNQPDYIEPKVNAVLTHDTEPVIDCGLGNEVSSLCNSFFQGDDIFVGVYITDYIQNDTAVTNVLRPDGSIYDSFNTFSNFYSYDWIWNSRYYLINSLEPGGTWTVSCEYRGITYEHTFQFINPNGPVTIPTFQDDKELNFYPNPFKDNIYINAITGSYQIEVHDLKGSLVANFEGASNNQIALNLNHLNPGLYFVTIKQNASEMLKVYKVLKE